MNTVKQALITFWNDEDGLTAVEYAVAGGLISLAVVGAFTALGGTVCGVLNSIDTALGGAGVTC